MVHERGENKINGGRLMGLSVRTCMSEESFYISFFQENDVQLPTVLVINRIHS
jgi:hypothetical protein